MRILPWLAVLSLLGTCAAAPATAPPPAAGAADWSWKDKVAAGGTVELRNVNGAITAEATTGDLVEVVGRKRASGPGDVDVTLEVVRHAGGVTICAVYPAPPGLPPNQCKPGGGGMKIQEGNHVGVALTVKLPAGLRFVARTVNGAITTSALGGEADVATVNGAIDVAAPEQVRAKTVNGSIHARIARTAWQGELHVATVNGSVTIDLPAEASTDVTAATVNGRIDSDFALSALSVETRGPRRLAGTIGRGGRALKVDTVNGSIAFRRGG